MMYVGVLVEELGVLAAHWPHKVAEGVAHGTVHQMHLTTDMIEKQSTI